MFKHRVLCFGALGYELTNVQHCYFIDFMPENDGNLLPVNGTSCEKNHPKIKTR
jgi:hypothetical protein